MPIDSLQHYRIRGTLGKGAMGEVYEAEDTRLQRIVALKILPLDVAEDASRLGRFQREAEAIAQLNHPNIVTIHSIEEEAGLHFITMEKVEGKSLGALIDGGPLELNRVLKVGGEIAAALEAAHEKGVVHRDLKPSNIMVTPDGRVKVLDFGLAKLDAVGAEIHESQATLTMTEAGAIVGTVPYMAPEQLEGKPVDARADLFALGVIMYEMATGERPFQAESRAGLISAILRDAPEAIDAVRKGLPPRLARVITSCLEKDREMRVGSARQVREQLERLDIEQAVESAVGSAPPTASRRPAARRWPIAVGAAAALLLLAGLAAVRWLPSAPVTEEPSAARESPLDKDELVSRRVMVVPFENRTGDSELDTVSLMTADWLTQGLTQTGRLEVVPLDLVLTAQRFVASDDGSGGVNLSAMARETRAGTVVSGSYYRQAGELIVHAALSDVSQGRLLGAIEPLRAPVGDPVTVLEELRQKVMTEVAVALDPSLSSYGVLVNQPPSYEAYEAYAEGMRSFVRLDFPAAIDAFLRAGSLDETFVTPRLLAATAYLNLRQYGQAADMVAEMQELRSAMAPLDRLHLDWMEAQCEGDQERALRLSRQAAELAPASTWVQTYGVVAMRNNRVAEAIETLAPLDPERGFLRGWAVHFHYLTMAYHLLGDHQKELEAARRGQRLYPETGLVLVNVARAQAALGLESALEETLASAHVLPPGPFAEGTSHAVAAFELEVHGEPELARRIAEQGLEWHRARPPQEAESPFLRADRARLLLFTERFDEARELFARIYSDAPQSEEALGLLGVGAVVAGDRQTEARVLEMLENELAPYRFGSHHYWRAVVEAWSGRRQQAVASLRSALAAGYPLAAPRHPHSDPIWKPLRGHPEFQETIRPTG